MPVLFRTTGTVSGLAFALQNRTPLRDAFRRVRMPVTCAIVERPDGLVLIDTGWSRAQCAFPHQDPGLLTQISLGLEVRAEDALASQLISLGYDPGDVKHIVATHLHHDHIGGAVDFPHATVHVSPVEWEARNAGRLRGYDPRLSGLADRVKCHALHDEPMLGFARSTDLFGDGSVLLLDAAGHTAGSIAVAVKLQEGWALHAGDACMFLAQLDDARIDDVSLYARVVSHDTGKQRTAYGALQRAVREHGARVIPSHDPDVYAKLPTTKEAAWQSAWDGQGKSNNKQQQPGSQQAREGKQQQPGSQQAREGKQQQQGSQQAREGKQQQQSSQQAREGKQQQQGSQKQKPAKQKQPQQTQRAENTNASESTNAKPKDKSAAAASSTNPARDVEPAT